MKKMTGEEALNNLCPGQYTSGTVYPPSVKVTPTFKVKTERADEIYVNTVRDRWYRDHKKKGDDRNSISWGDMNSHRDGFSCEFHITFRCLDFNGTFSAGNHHLELPKFTDVISALVEDARSALGQTYEGWCGEFGYDRDSIKSAKAFSECQGALLFIVNVDGYGLLNPPARVKDQEKWLESKIVKMAS